MDPRDIKRPMLHIIMTRLFLNRSTQTPTNSPRTEYGESREGYKHPQHEGGHIEREDSQDGNREGGEHVAELAYGLGEPEAGKVPSP